MSEPLPADQIRKGDVIATNYSNKRYVVVGISGPCTCPKYLDPPSVRSIEHWHFTCEEFESESSKLYYLNGFAPEYFPEIDAWGWSSVWNDDFIAKTGDTAVPTADVQQLELFA